MQIKYFFQLNNSLQPSECHFRWAIGNIKDIKIPITENKKVTDLPGPGDNQKNASECFKKSAEVQVV